MASVTAFVFLSTSFIQAAPAPAVTLNPPPFAAPVSLQIPQELGSIQETFFAAGKPPSVYLIQDAHDSLDAQENIRLILKQLVEQEKVSLVCFEGGIRELDRSFYNFARDPKRNQKIWDALFRDGEIGGLERFALETSKNVRLFGVEDSKSYFDNIHSIQSVFLQTDQACGEIQKKDAEFSTRAGRILSGDVKKIRDLKKSFEAKRITLERYAKDLTKWMNEIANPANQRQWPELVRVLKLAEIESRIKNINLEIPAAIQNVLRSPFAKGHLRWFIERLVDEGFDFGKNQELKDWIGFQILADELDARDLFEEVEQLELQVLARMNLSEEVRGFLREEAAWELQKKLMRLELTRKEWEAVKRQSASEMTLRARTNYTLVEARDKFLAEKTLKKIRQFK